MDEKQLVSQALSAAIDGVLGVEQIAAIIEKPKSSDLGDLAFPAFQLAKTLRKSPQIIAGEIAEKIDTILICSCIFIILLFQQNLSEL